MVLWNLVFELWYRYGRPDWVIDAPQPELVAAAEEGVVRGPTVLDVGCGTGDNAIYLARRGLDVTGVDLSSAAIARARDRARSAGADVRFRVLDALRLPALGERFATILDFGLFHDRRFSEGQLREYVSGLGQVCVPGGQVLLLCFRDFQANAERLGPRQVRQDELRRAFADGWSVEWIRPAAYHNNRSGPAPAWLALMRRTAG